MTVQERGHNLLDLNPPTVTISYNSNTATAPTAATSPVQVEPVPSPLGHVEADSQSLCRRLPDLPGRHTRATARPSARKQGGVREGRVVEPPGGTTAMAIAAYNQKRCIWVFRPHVVWVLLAILTLD